MVLAVPEHVEEKLEDPVLRAGIPGRGQGVIGALDRGDLAVTVYPRSEDRQEDVTAATRYVAPPGRSLVIHRQGEATGPEQVERDVTHQLVPAAVAALLDAPEDVRTGRGLRLEVAPDDAVELIETVDHGEVELGDEVGRKDDPVVAIENEWVHGASYSSKS